MEDDDEFEADDEADTEVDAEDDSKDDAPLYFENQIDEEPLVPPAKPVPRWRKLSFGIVAVLLVLVALINLAMIAWVLWSRFG